jgi:protein-S-isoprenylcysteine O-methyltransferase Ste14
MKARFLVSVQFGLLGLLLLTKGEKLKVGTEMGKFVPFFYLLGFLILVSAFLALRPSLRVSPIPREGAPLIVNGIYKWLRHPMYVGVLLIGAGLAIRQLSYLSIVLWLLLFVDLVVKARYEDDLLLQAHPTALQYQQQVRGILLTKKKR